RISESVLLPSSFRLTTEASLYAERSRSIRRADVVATTLLPCRKFSSTLGPLPSHLTVYSPAASDLPLTVTGSLTWREPLLAANALVASSKASPSSKPLNVFENVIWTPCSFPKTVGNRFWGGLGFTFAEKLAFRLRKPTMLPRG